MDAPHFEIVSLGDVVGAEVRGVDYRRPVPALAVEAIDRALYEYLVLVFRGQNAMTEDEQIVFSEQLGPLEKPPARADDPSPRATTRLVANVDLPHRPLEPYERHETEMYFHHDSCFRELPQKGLFLHALQVPSCGGNTLFANMYSVYDALPADVKERLEGRLALNVFKFDRNSRPDIADGYNDMLHHRHPAVIRHPGTGRQALYVNRLMTMQLDGLDQTESDQLLDYLFEFSEQPQFIYEHVWQEGDIVLWDNLAVMHGRGELQTDEARIMRHTALQGIAIPTA